MGDDYQQVTRVVKTKRDEGKVKRWVVNPMVGLMNFKVKDSKKDRVSA